MKPTLKIQYELRENGLDATVEKFKLLAKQKGNLILFKYDQINSSYSHEEVQECRGLILDASNNWEIVCYPFHKFFNIEEGYAHTIDWNTAKVYIKLDGSLISMYFYQNKWHISTSGVLDAETGANGNFKTFRQLVIDTIQLQYNKTFEEFTQVLNPLYYYMFELCTPYNIVVTPHTESKIYLLGLRNSVDLLETSIEPYKGTLDICESVALSNVNDIRKTFDNMTWAEEGYVVCDAKFNRVKIKNPLYVSVHHTKNAVGPYHIMDVIKSNEIDEFCSYFSERSIEAKQLQLSFNKLHNDLLNVWVNDLNSGNDFDTQKDFAIFILKNYKKYFTSLFFNLNKNRNTTNTSNIIRTWLCELDNKFIYEYLSNNSTFLLSDN